MPQFNGAFSGSGPFSRVFPQTTCFFTMTFNGTIALDITVNQDGTVSGTGQISGTTNSVSTGGDVPDLDCIDSTFGFSGSGSVSGTTSDMRFNFSGSFVSGSLQGSVNVAAGTITATSTVTLMGSSTGSAISSVSLQGDPADSALAPPRWLVLRCIEGRAHLGQYDLPGQQIRPGGESING